nr:zinc finger protein 436-like isoform X1 [Pogona vitticeps]XP_020671491.1 zinc finger protein 436-like isoform X1 [Pogona vitticeps]XP_020671492.1 zinc finger protein 436-like isoform X1 [Pogona vitticeps]
MIEEQRVVTDQVPEGQTLIEPQMTSTVKTEEREPDIPVLRAETGAKESEKAPHVIQAGSIQEFLQRASGKPLNQIPGEGLLQQWETQWQEFLKTLESPCSGWGVPSSPPEPSPWEDTKAFLTSFEQVAKACRWPREEWVTRLLPALDGEGEEALGSLAAEERKDYGKVKAAILRGDRDRREKKRQQFRHFSYQPAEGVRGTYNQLQELCNQWLKAERLSKEQILEQLVLEQFLAVLPPEVQQRLMEQGPETSAQAVALAEDVLLQRPEAEQQNDLQVPRRAGLNSPETEGTQLVPEQGPSMVDPCEETSQGTGNADNASFLSADPIQNDSLTENEKSHLPGESPLPMDPEASPITEQEVSQRCQQGGESGTSEGLAKEAKVNPNMKLVVRLNEIRLGISGNKEDASSSQILKSLTQKIPCVKLLSIQVGERPYMCSKYWEQGETPGCSNRSAKDAKKSSNKKVAKKLNENQAENKGESASPPSTKSFKLKPPSIWNGRRPYKCSECGKHFSCRAYLSKHQRIHSGEKPHQCSYCGRRFRERSHLIKHERLHTGEKPYKCEDCGKTFRQSANLGKHLKMHVGVPIYKCPDCGKSFRQRVKFYQHRKVHTSGERYPCSQCEETFDQLSLLQKHQRTHAPERAHKCPVCNKSFSYQSSFLKHQMTHTGEKPYKCSACGKRFNQSSNLHKHYKIHTGEKPYKCSTCGKSFIQSSHLSLHLNTHKGFKTFKCLDCGDSFTDRSHLMKHKLTHAGEKEGMSA